MNRLRVARASLVSIVLAVALGVSQPASAAVPPPPQDHPYVPAEWSGFVVDVVKIDSALDPAASPSTSDLRSWNALTVYDFSATPLLGGETTGNLYIETEPSPGIVCAHRTTWSETYALQKHPGEYVGFVGWSADQYTLDAAGSVDLPLSQTDAYTGDPSWCATGTFTSDAAGSFPLQWDNTHGTYAVGDTKLQGDVDKFYGPQFPGVEEHFCWRLTWLPDGDSDGLPDSEDPQPAVFDGSICQGGSKNALSVSVAGQGSVTSSDSEINCPPACSASYQGGDVSLTPHPAAGWRFVGWSGDCTGTANCSLSMNQTRSVSATFELIQHRLKVAVSGSGTVDSSPSGINCPLDCLEDYAGGSVTLSAHPAPGWQLRAWSGDCTGSAACSTAMVQDRSVTATFERIPVPVGRTFHVELRSFIPGDHVLGPGGCVFKHHPRKVYFEGDDRGFRADVLLGDYRTEQAIDLSVSQATGRNYTDHVGITRKYASDALADGSITRSDRDATLHDCHLLDDQGYADASGSHFRHSVSTIINGVSVHFHGDVGNPIALPRPFNRAVCNIDYEFDVDIVQQLSGGYSYTVTGEHDGFPAFEIYINNQPVYRFMPKGGHLLDGMKGLCGRGPLGARIKLQ
jgi:Divergent InlB B-repeat domain